MRVLHVPFSYWPDAAGGTEVYVAALCRELRALGLDSVVAAPARSDGTSLHQGTPVHRFATDPAPTLPALYGEGDAQAAGGFERILDEVRPDLVHFHAFSPAVSVLCLRAVKKRGLPVVFTYHTPTASCQRGTLMRWGKIPCDGEMRTQRCSACTLHHLGVPKPLAHGAAWLSVLAGPWLARRGARGGWRTALQMRPLVRKRLDAVREFWQGADRIIALCDWTQRVLAINQVPASKVVKIRHGLTQSQGSPGGHGAGHPSPGHATGRPVRLAFLGRLDPTKGADLIIEAMHRLPGLPLELHLFTLPQSGGEGVAQDLLAGAADDPRIIFHDPVPAADVVETLKGFDALLVPSRCLETGPLVVLEAFAAGIPVIGSRLGGIAEWVDHGRNGLLVDHPAPDSWAAALRRFTGDAILRAGLRAGVAPPRSMHEVAGEVASVYREVTG